MTALPPALHHSPDLTEYQHNDTTIYAGSCLTALAEIPDNSIDAVITDPPYGLANTDAGHVIDTLARWFAGDRDYLPAGAGFMGKAWDAFVPPPAVWDECLRVLKPGGHLLCFAGTRTVDLMGLSIRLAGFEIRDSLAWLYGSGFPKSLDVSKAIDKMRDDRSEILAVTSQIKALRDAAGLTNRQLDDLFEFAGMAGHWTSTKSQPAVPTVEQWTKLRDVLSPPAELDAEVWRLNGRKGTPGEAWAQRPVVGVIRNNQPGGTSAFAQGGIGEYRRGDARERDVIGDSVNPAAQQWQGWGTALKPAFEPVIVARKPFPGTVAANVLAHGTGALNIDGTRVTGGNRPLVVSDRRSGNEVYGDGLQGSKAVQGGTSAGRWPANVLLDEGMAARLDQEVGFSKSSDRPRHNTAAAHNQTSSMGKSSADWTTGGHGDSGGPSRFFPVFRYQAKAPTSERPNVDGVAHPTVKPLDLMRWLITLVTPPGGTILDPFAGSGTTGEAAALQNTRAILMENDPTYLPLIFTRLDRAAATR